MRHAKVGLYHIEHVRSAVPTEFDRVGHPRHSVIFKIADDGAIEILGFIHDSMLLGRAFRRLTKD